MSSAPRERPSSYSAVDRHAVLKRGGLSARDERREPAVTLGRSNGRLRTAVVHSGPLLLGGVLPSLVAVLVLSRDAVGMRVWSLAVALVCLALLWSLWPFDDDTNVPSWMPPAEPTFVVAGTILCALLCIAPWIVVPLPDVPREAFVLVFSGTALCAAVTFATLPASLMTALAIPAAWVADTAIRGDATGRPPAPTLLLGMLAIVGIGATALVVARRRVRAVALEAHREEMIVEIARTRDAALLADQEKSRFLAIASHDLRQPLHAVALFAAALDERMRGTENESATRDVIQSIESLNRSFNAIMDVSQIDAGAMHPKMQQFPLRDLFRRLHLHYAGQAEAAGLNLRFAPGGRSVTSDPHLLERILGNLVQNAIKYTDRGGIVVVARARTSATHVEVWDTGVGIAPAELPRVFDEFYQVSDKGRPRMRGLGMGLAIVKRLCRLLGHDLTVASTVGRGSMFRLAIARGTHPELDAVIEAADTIPMPLEGHRVALAVEDDATVRSGLEMLLAEWGYRAMTAADLDQALYLLRFMDAPPDVLVCDFHLGAGPDGVAAIAAIRERCGRVPAILITADPTNAKVALAPADAVIVLAKPVLPRALRGALRALESGALGGGT